MMNDALGMDTRANLKRKLSLSLFLRSPYIEQPNFDWVGAENLAWSIHNPASVVLIKGSIQMQRKKGTACSLAQSSS